MTGVASHHDDTCADLRDLLRGRLVAAALTPFHRDRTVAREAVAGYAEALRGGGCAAIAVGAHTGRGAHLDAGELRWLVREFGSASSLPIVAGVGPGPDRSVSDLLPLAAGLRDAGAAALLVAPVRGASRAEIVRLHERLGSEVGLPLLAFVLYDRASGCQYDADTVAELLTLPWVCGVKLALLDDAMGCQDILDAARTAAPDALLLTGEDRMYGPSLMWGAEASLLGLAAALPDWSVAVLEAWTRNDLPAFVAASARADALARLTFLAPMEAYVQRMAWVAAWQGILPDAVAFDPFGPYAQSPPPGERDRLISALPTLSRDHDRDHETSA
ncbi:dihydrodipicolinate synthase family protein [Actinopolymorpha sp. B9G3]|uniref:dihydrodipicolinate synthase family protein n=1 Tax=Actinopolymorpha sp. B9G3 TaxID=3158970 RepID=UPI0032D97CC2